MSQQSQKFDLPSGAVLAVTIAPFSDAWALLRATLKTVKGTDLKPEELNKDMEALTSNPSAFKFMLDRIVEFATSSEVESAMWRCAQRALYVPVGSPADFPGMKVNPSLFDDADHGNSAREDYAKIVVSLMEVNCKPFLAKALSGLIRPKAEILPEGQLQKSA